MREFRIDSTKLAIAIHAIARRYGISRSRNTIDPWSEPSIGPSIERQLTGWLPKRGKRITILTGQRSCEYWWIVGFHVLSCTFRPLPHLRFRQRESCMTALVQSLHHRVQWKGHLRSWTPAVPGFLEGSRNLGTVNRPRRRGDVALLVHRPVALCVTNTTERLTPYLSRFHFSTKLTSNLQNCLPMIREIN